VFFGCYRYGEGDLGFLGVTGALSLPLPQELWPCRCYRSSEPASFPFLVLFLVLF